MRFLDACEGRNYCPRHLLTLIADSLTDPKLSAHSRDVKTVYSTIATGANKKKEYPEDENIIQVLNGSFHSSIL